MKEKFLLRVKYKIIAIMMMAITIRRVDLSTKRRLTKSDKSTFILIILIRKEQVIRVIIGKSFDNFL